MPTTIQLVINRDSGIITNGDIIESAFPDAKVTNAHSGVYMKPKYATGVFFDKRWWNSPYKEE